MLKNQELDTEGKILEAAKKVIITKDFDGTRMQDIADTAQINKSMLHYYYRSKDKLFELIFLDQMKKHHQILQDTLSSNSCVRDKLLMLISAHYDKLIN